MLAAFVQVPETVKRVKTATPTPVSTPPVFAAKWVWFMLAKPVATMVGVVRVLFVRVWARSSTASVSVPVSSGRFSCRSAAMAAATMS